MNCQEALDLLYDIIDKEASEIDTRQVQSHLKKCRHCFERYRLEESVQALINEKVKAAKSAPDVEALKSNILNRLDAIDSGKQPEEKRGRPPFFSVSRTLAIAASLVIVVGAAMMVASFTRHTHRYIPLEKAHWNVVEGMEQFQDPTSTNASLAHVQRAHAYRLAEAEDGFRLAGGHMEELMDSEMAHFVYENGEQYISVFIADAENFSIPDDVMENSVTINGITYYDHHCRGCRLVYHRIGDAIVITATTDHQTDLLSFVPGSI